MAAVRARGEEALETDAAALETHATFDSAGMRTALAFYLERAIATLPLRARAVLVLYDIEGWKHEEIATEPGMAVGSSKAQLQGSLALPSLPRSAWPSAWLGSWVSGRRPIRRWRWPSVKPRP